MSAARDATIRVWNARSGLQAALLAGVPTVTHCVARSPDGRRLPPATRTAYRVLMR
ncbi:MAG: hypothetical protein U0872_00480 [Planctomycetaceae bacterium]